MGDRFLKRNLSQEELMVWWIMPHADHKGTDVRLTAGQVMEPSRIPRQGIDSTRLVALERSAGRPVPER